MIPAMGRTRLNGGEPNVQLRPVGPMEVTRRGREQGPYKGSGKICEGRIVPFLRAFCSNFAEKYPCSDVPMAIT